MVLALIIERYASWVARHPVAVLILTAVVSCLLGAGVRHLHVEIDPDQQLPQHHPYVRAFHKTHALFGDRNLLIVGISSYYGDAFDHEMVRLVFNITADILKLPGCTPFLVQSIASPSVTHVELAANGLVVGPLLDTPPETAVELRQLRQRTSSFAPYERVLVPRTNRASLSTRALN
jgi:predicted RND superfamily exporter protein